MLLQIISFAINVVGNLEYIQGTLKGKYQPQRATWVIWATIMTITLLNYKSLGAEDSSWFVAGDWVVTLVIALAALKVGVKGWTRLDKAMLGLAAVSLSLWLVLDAPFIALLCLIAADIAGALPTLKHAIEDPTKESFLPYAASSIAALAGFYLVGEWDFDLMLYPFYLFVINLIIAIVIIIGQQHSENK